MTKLLTTRNAIIASVAGAVLLGGLAIAESQGGDFTIDDMLEKVGERFDEVDTDGDGVISEAEAEAAEAAHLADFGFVRGNVNRTGAHKQGNLSKGVSDDMQSAAHGSHGGG